MAMRLFDTARRAVVPFDPGDTVTMYVCGITPYDATHLGHAATYTTFDVLQRRHPDVSVYTPVIDRELNLQKLIVPGLGDFGDRLYGTT